MIECANPLSSYSIAVVGLGRAGWAQHFLPLTRQSTFRLTGAVDPMEERRAEAAALQPECRTYETLEALLEDQHPDIVVIATPSVAHFADASLVLNAGCHCILEKPMTTTADEAFALVQLAEEARRHLFIHQQHAFGREAALLSALRASGELGDWFEIRTFWGGFNRRRDWQTLKKNGGGQLNNTFPHIMSVVTQVLPGPFQVDYASLRTVKDAGDAEDHLHVVLHTSEGLTLDVVASTSVAIPEPRWRINGTCGALSIHGQTATVRYYNSAKASPADEVIDGAAPGRLYNLDELEWQEKQLFLADYPEENFYHHVANVLAGQAAMRVSATECAEIIALLEKIREQSYAPTFG